MPDDPLATEMDGVMADASAALAEKERESRMIDAFRLSAACAAHVRTAWGQLAGDSFADVPPVPMELAQWHLIQVHMRALAAWNGTEGAS